jgi:bile acid:Na+ symporter, BASS family
MNGYKLLLILSALCLVGALALLLTGNTASAGPLLTGFFITLGIGFRGYQSLKGFTYTMMIFAAVTTALCYPATF